MHTPLFYTRRTCCLRILKISTCTSMVGRARVNSEPPEVFASSVRLIARAANWFCFAPVNQVIMLMFHKTAEKVQILWVMQKLEHVSKCVFTFSYLDLESATIVNVWVKVGKFIVRLYFVVLNIHLWPRCLFRNFYNENVLHPIRFTPKIIIISNV